MNDNRLAAFNGHEVILSMIMGAMVELEAQYQHRRTALIWAAELDHEKVAVMLLDKGAETNAQGRRFDDFLLFGTVRAHRWPLCYRGRVQNLGIVSELDRSVTHVLSFQLWTK